MLYESGLDGVMVMFIPGESFDGGDVGIVGAGCGHHTCHNGDTIEENSASATFTFGAAFFRSDEVGIFS